MAIPKLEGTLLYVQVDKPKPCYEKEKGVEWKCSIAVDEDTADNWDETYPKQQAKRVKTTDFESLYKTNAPFPKEKKQCIITLRKNTLLANGAEVPDIYKCRVFLKTESGNNQDITDSKLVANGSKGVVSVDHYDAKLGAVARLKNVLVTDLIEYTASSAVSGSEFENTPNVKTPEKVKPTTKPTKVAAPIDEYDSDVPF